MVLDSDYIAEYRLLSNGNYNTCTYQNMCTVIISIIYVQSAGGGGVSGIFPNSKETALNASRIVGSNCSSSAGFEGVLPNAACRDAPKGLGLEGAPKPEVGAPPNPLF